MRRLRPLFCAALFAFALSGCDTLPTRATISPEQEMAERLYAEGDFPAAAQAFLDAARRSRAQRDLLTLRAAEAWREDGQIEEARTLVAMIGERRLDADGLLRLNLLRAELALIDRDPQRALDALGQPIETVPEGQRDRVYFLRAQAYAGLDRPFEAARERAALEAWLPTGEREENSQAIVSLLGQMRPADLQRASAGLSRSDPLYDYAARQLRSLGLAMPTSAGHTGASTGARANRVALLLPRSGPLAAAGEAVRDGFMAAYYADAGEQRPEVLLYDAGDSVEQNLQAFREASADGAERIVGPLSREAIGALFEMGTLQTPVLALNRGTVTPPPGSQSFALSPEDEGMAAAERMLALGYKRVVVANGGDEHARRVLSALVPTFARGGGSVVTEIVPPGASPDYSGEIRRAIAAAGQRPADAQSAPDRSGAVLIDADAIYLAVRSEQARLLVPQLRSAGIFDRPLLASSQILGGDGTARPDRDFDGIEFTELPWLLGASGPGMPSQEEARPLRSAQGASARLFAFGLDAYRVLAALPALSRLPGSSIEGATGSLSLDEFGQIQRRPGWGRFRGARTELIPGGETGLLLDGGPGFR